MSIKKGLVGGSVPVHDEIVLSLAKINKIHKFDEQTNILTADAGVVLEHANEYVKQHGCELPWDLGSKGSCMIGGNTATHAGGKYYVKYGPMRASILVCVDIGINILFIVIK
jgi:FAD/FMN-containing dehydrogenase